jgi:pimeloyl-ACP methyl ester carboxylesterase
MLLDRGYGAVGVVINSAPTEGVKAVPLSQVRSTFPVLKNPANHHRAVGLTPKQWHYVFTNTFTEEESRRLYDRYHVAASGRNLFNSILANFEPGPQDTWVDYHNDARPPLLFISGGEDHLMPPKVQRSNAKHYKSNTITEVRPCSRAWHTSSRPRRGGRKSPTTRWSGRSPRPAGREPGGTGLSARPAW